MERTPGASSSLCVHTKNQQILVCGEQYVNCSQMAQRRFAVLSTHTHLWFANHLVCSCIRDLTFQKYHKCGYMTNITQLRWLAVKHHYSHNIAVCMQFPRVLFTCLKVPQKFLLCAIQIADDLVQYLSLLWLFAKNSSSLVKSLLNILMLFLRYSCFRKNWQFLFTNCCRMLQKWTRRLVSGSFERFFFTRIPWNLTFHFYNLKSMVCSSVIAVKIFTVSSKFSWKASRIFF